MKIIAFFLTFLSALTFSQATLAQGFGGHPPSVKWFQIDTDNVRVIFPSGLDNHANRIASLINYIHDNNTQGVGDKTKKIDLVLQTNQIQSNGYVALAPYRSEFYATPTQNNNTLSTLDWLDILSIHEYRHALQFSNANRGVTKFFHIISGQSGWLALQYIGIPNWYFEGDAVVSETTLSPSGRGRTPAFFKEQRALLLYGKDYSYMKARNGSYKDLLPNHYPLGYVMMNYGRNNFGTTIWKDVLADAGAYRTIIYPFSGAMKKHMGMRAPKMYKASYADLKQKWNSELAEITLTSQSTLTPRDAKTITNNQYSNYLEDGSVVYLSSSFKNTAAIYHLVNGEHKRLTSVGSNVESFLSENSGKLAWTEIELSPRWSNLTYNKLVTFDIETGEKKVVANNTKLFSPEFSNSGSSIVATQFGNTLSSQIVILDSNSGEIIKTIPNPDNHVISYPSYTIDDKAIVYVAKKNSKVAIIKQNLESNQSINLTDWTHNSIGKISVGENIVVFSASFTGIDNIFSVSLKGDKEITQLTSVKVGAYQPTISLDGNLIAMSEFTDKGYTLTSLSLSDALNSKVEIQEPTEMEQFDISLDEFEGNILNEFPEQEYVVQKYKGLLNGTKLHSWGLVTDDNTTGLQLAFTNILNDFNTVLAGTYDRNEKTYRFNGDFQYAKYFTVLNLSVQEAERRTALITQFQGSTFLLSKEFNQVSLSAGLSVPLTWQRGNYTTGLEIRSDFVSYRVSDSDISILDDFNFNSFESRFIIYNLRRTALQNTQTRFGQYAIATFGTSLSDISGQRFNIQTGIYLPGFLVNHGFLIEGEYQKELLGNSYQYIDFFNYSRGYGYPTNDEAYRLSLNYQLPLFYPDWGFFNMAYFKRIRSNLFFDVSKSKINVINDILTRKSYGAELIIDNILGNILPLSFIGRFSLLPDALPGQDSSNFEFFIQASL